MPLTGPAAAGYSKIAPATKAYFDYVNKNGGVHSSELRGSSNHPLESESQGMHAGIFCLVVFRLDQMSGVLGG
jgi:hypothetical protein